MFDDLKVRRQDIQKIINNNIRNEYVCYKQYNKHRNKEMFRSW